MDDLSEIDIVHDAEVQRKSIDVLRDKMIFYDEMAVELINKIVRLLKEENKRGDLLAQMYKESARCNDIAIDCAAKLAPFEFPKLQSKEITKEVTHAFVVRAPAVMHDPETWLAEVGAPPDPMKMIEQKET